MRHRGFEFAAGCSLSGGLSSLKAYVRHLVLREELPCFEAHLLSGEATAVFEAN